MATRRKPRPNPAAKAESAAKKPVKRELLALVAVGVVLAVVLAAVYTGDGGHTGYVPGETGDLAADFSLIDTEGNAFSLAQYQGSVVIIDFMGTTCEPCKTQIDNLKSIYSSYTGSGVKIFSIDVNPTDTSSYLHNYKLERGATWSFAVDSIGIYMDQGYDVHNIPTIIIINQQGEIVNRTEGVMSAGQIATILNPLFEA